MPARIMVSRTDLTRKEARELACCANVFVIAVRNRRDRERARRPWPEAHEYGPVLHATKTRLVGFRHTHLAWVIGVHRGYFGLTGNKARLPSFRQLVTRILRHGLGRRCRGSPRMRACFRTAVLARLRMPPAKVVHLISAGRADLKCEEPDALMRALPVLGERGVARPLSARSPP